LYKIAANAMQLASCIILAYLRI